MRRISLTCLAAAAGLTLGCDFAGDATAAPMRLARWVQGEDANPRQGEGEGEAKSAPAGREDAPPRVTLSGETRDAVRPPPRTVPLYATAPRTWVHSGPSSSSTKLGYLRAGAVVASRPGVAGTAGCEEGYRAILPEGFVCAGQAVTENATDPIAVALSTTPPNPGRRLPYLYGTVRKPGPVYARLPTATELDVAEPEIEKRMERWLGTEGEAGAGYAQFVWLGQPGAVPDPAGDWQERRTVDVPAFLASGMNVPNLHRKPRDPDQLVIDRMRSKVGYSFVRTFVAGGRRYGLTPELEVLPTDRLRPIQGSSMHGFELGKGVDLPVALVRKEGARYLDYDRKTNTTSRGEVAPYRQPIPLTGRKQFWKGVLHFETRDGRWLADRDASRIDPAKKLPGWAIKGERWIDVNITKQTLVLYEGEKPAYATLVSTGEAGIGDAKSSTATPRGIFRIHTKHVTATMASDEVGEEFELRDVPYVQYFDDGGHAIHGAYWHDRFGVPKSHGCINLAPEDARRLFYFTGPTVPDHWHGAMDARTGTILFIHS